MEETESGIVFSRFLQTCDIPITPYKIDPFTIVIFGGSGDLSKRKLLPTLFHLFRGSELPDRFSILGFGRININDEQYRAMMKEAVIEFGEDPFDESQWDEFGRHLFFLSGRFEEEEGYKELCNRIREFSLPSIERNVIYYMAVPPQATPVIIEKLKLHNLCKGELSARIIVEKPFGRDISTAKELNKILLGAFDEKQIYRIDHYLGKETVQNIIFFRFSNAVFERLWNSRYIDHVQITVAEEIGTGQRGIFYEQTGVIRDIVQSHIMQLIALIAMEPPIGFEADFIRDEKLKVLRAIQPIDEETIGKSAVFGQYGQGNIRESVVPGYREEEYVAPDSSVPTFFAGKFHIANWRWAGVPFYVRTGKRLRRRVTEICIQFKQPPLKLFGRACDILKPNVIALTVQPEEKITLRFGVKYPLAQNQIYPVNMVFGYQDTFKVKPHPAYERLIIDCMRGDLTLFIREDAVEAMWEIADPLTAYLEKTRPADFPNYQAGSWGPAESDLLLQRDGRIWLTE